MNPEAGARVVKRSLVIAGHRTSVSLEDAFWRRLKAIAAGRGLSMNALAAAVDAARGEANLSSALRVFVLEALAPPSPPTRRKRGRIIYNNNLVLMSRGGFRVDAKPARKPLKSLGPSAKSAQSAEPQ